MCFLKCDSSQYSEHFSLKMSYFKLILIFSIIIISKAEKKDNFNFIFENFLEKSVLNVDAPNKGNKGLICNCSVSQNKILSMIYHLNLKIIDCFQVLHKEKYFEAFQIPSHDWI